MESTGLYRDYGVYICVYISIYIYIGGSLDCPNEA